MVKGLGISVQDKLYNSFMGKLQTALQYIYFVPFQHIKSILIKITGIEVNNRWKCDPWVLWIQWQSLPATPILAMSSVFNPPYWKPTERNKTSQ